MVQESKQYAAFLSGRRQSVVHSRGGEHWRRECGLESWGSKQTRFIHVNGFEQTDFGLEAKCSATIGTFDQENGRLPLLDDPMNHNAFGILPSSGFEANQVAQGKRTFHGFSLLVESSTARRRSPNPFVNDVIKRVDRVRPNL
jgi:hypothetical protein